MAAAGEESTSSGHLSPFNAPVSNETTSSVDDSEESVEGVVESQDVMNARAADVPREIETVETAASTTTPLSKRASHPRSARRRRKRSGGHLAEDTPSEKRGQRRRSLLKSYPMPSSPSTETSSQIISQLKSLYKKKVLPIERRYGLHSLCLPTNDEIHDAEFDARPMVLLLGQYSTGKTSFIRFLVGGDFPGMHIGPEPTTDKFMALVHGGDGHGASGQGADDDSDSLANDADFKFWSDDHGTGKKMASDRTKGKIVKGNTLTVTPELPFSSLSKFGASFLKHFDGSVSSAPLLEHITLIDTPGVLSGEKQRLSRDYDFAQAAKWFADRSDLILLLFDAHKLDISDELKGVVETIRPHNDDKIRCILNKADGVTKEQLVRVYGSLMWSMGKLFHTPEVVRVYTGSFWEEPLVHDDFRQMFESDEGLLIQELVNLQSMSAERKVNALVKRIRLVKVHVCILGYLHRQMPPFSRFFGRERARDSLIKNMAQVFEKVRTEYGLSSGDMPDATEFASRLGPFHDFSTFPIPDARLLRQLDDLIKTEIPSLMRGAGGVSSGGDTSHARKGPRHGAWRRVIRRATSMKNRKKHDRLADGHKMENDSQSMGRTVKRIWSIVYKILLAGAITYFLIKWIILNDAVGFILFPKFSLTISDGSSTSLGNEM